MMLVQGKRYAVYSLHEIKEKEGKEPTTVWTRAGAAWINRDGSMNLSLDVLPLQGRLHVREQPEKREERPTQATASAPQPAHAPHHGEAPASFNTSFTDAAASMGDH